MTCAVLDSSGVSHQVVLTVLDSSGAEFEISGEILNSAGKRFEWCSLGGGTNITYPIILTKELREDDELLMKFAEAYMKQ